MRINAIALQAAALAAVLLSAATARAEPSALGVWIDHTGRGAVEIKDCNGKLCGYVAWVKDSKDADGCGEQILGDVKSIGGGKWDHGWIYDPDSESKYDVELTPLDNDKLRVVGYAGTKWLSETMTWKRAPADLQKCAKPATQAKAPAEKTPPVTAAAAPAKAEMKEAKSEAGVRAKPEAKSEAKSETMAKAESKPESEPEVAETPDDEDAANPAKRAHKRGKALAEIAEALNVKKIGGRRCRMNVPYVDMVVTFPCDR